ncbi:hypothetical protein DFQ26_008112 [Actinomortierella ambigua]|nr:hypothetical protein DFQ26_008112 [Actinomortierella ambigua]
MNPTCDTSSSSQLSPPSPSGPNVVPEGVSLVLTVHTIIQSVLRSPTQGGNTAGSKGPLLEVYVEQDNENDGILSAMALPVQPDPDDKKVALGKQSDDKTVAPVCLEGVGPHAEIVDDPASHELQQQQEEQEEHALSTASHEATAMTTPLSRRKTASAYSLAEHREQQGQQYLMDTLSQIYFHSRSSSNSSNNKASSQTTLSRSSSVTCTSKSSKATQLQPDSDGKGFTTSTYTNPAIESLRRHKSKSSTAASKWLSSFLPLGTPTSMILTSAGYVAPSYTLQPERVTGLEGDDPFATPTTGGCRASSSSVGQHGASMENNNAGHFQDQNHDGDKKD